MERHETIGNGWTSNLGKIVVIAIKLAVTVACFWYVAGQIDPAALSRTFVTIDPGWIGIAIVLAVLQCPLIALRWHLILSAVPGQRIALAPVTAITWFSLFLGQVLPYAAGDAMRVWLVSRLGLDWRTALATVLIDRGVGVASLFACGLAIFLLPSAALPGFEGYRNLVIVVFGVVLSGAVVGLAAIPWITPLLIRWRYTHWIGTTAAMAHAVLLRSRMGGLAIGLAIFVHTLTILWVWCIGRALGIPLSLVDASVLFVLILGVTLIPISIAGWGLREVAVVALLSAHAVPAEAALSLSIAVGLVLILGALPGVAIWALYSPAVRPGPVGSETSRAR